MIAEPEAAGLFSLLRSRLLCQRFDWTMHAQVYGAGRLAECPCGLRLIVSGITGRARS